MSMDEELAARISALGNQVRLGAADLAVMKAPPQAAVVQVQDDAKAIVNILKSFHNCDLWSPEVIAEELKRASIDMATMATCWLYVAGFLSTLAAATYHCTDATNLHDRYKRIANDLTQIMENL